ncbi:hypothetical protein [Hansschlegelia plantiphila]|uniref:hypothetical protein n=1 Tax=Hansschlegelia plantiphila TaxID=374655 RepID=UPI0022F29561|nr:hypothetical protein [Hansschlegelia plantiphila]
MKRVLGASLIAFAAASAAEAQTCESNFQVSGVPMLTALSYRTSLDFPKIKPDQALRRLAQAVAAEGFSGVRLNKSLGSIDAFQETTGSGRPQTLRVVARKTGAGTRVDAVFDIQQGQLTSESVVRKGLCTIVRSAAE